MGYNCFNDARDKINLVPVYKVFNNGTWKAIESDLAKARDASKNVSVKIDIGYPDSGGVRPNRFIVTTKINGIEETIPFRQ